jgi:CheY-like chemotaxis protein/K+-sensing histidine kinase KdpD
MPEQSVVREPARPLRRAVRAAATVVIAIGASGVVAQLAPHYGPLYAYLAALVAIAWLEGIVVAAVGAAAFLAAYELIVVPGAIDLRSWIIIGSLTGLVLLAVGFIRYVRRPKREPAPELPAVPDDAEIAALRAQLADALAKLYEANQMRATESAAAGSLETQLCEQYEQEIEHAQRAAAAALEDVERMRSENDALRRRVDEERAACEHLDTVWGEKLHKIVAELATDHENDLGDAVAQREEARAEVRSLQMKLNSMQQAAAKSVPPRRPLILVVHHDPTMRAMSRDSLDRGGFDTIAAADGLEGLRLTVAHKPDVVVADASMPKMDGRELCQLIKSNPETAGVKVVLVSADARDEVPRELGPDELLRKPVKFDVLHSTLTRLTGSA